MPVDIYADTSEPQVVESGHVWSVGIPWDKESRMYPVNLWVSVDRYGLIDKLEGTFQGVHTNTMEWEQSRKIYEYLQEWELVTLRKIGPEDSEWFATKKLDKEYGVE